MKTSRIAFAGSRGNLVGRIHRPAGVPAAFAVFAHCFTCSKDIRAAVRIADALAAHGIGVLRFDFTGLGESEGEFSQSDFSSNVDDLVAACAFLARENEAPRILIGHSLGGAAVLAAAARLPEIVAVATIGAPADPAHVKALFSDSEEEIEGKGEAEVSIGGRPFRIRRDFLRDLEAQHLPDSLASLGRALLVCHAPLDNIVGIDNARRIFEAAKHPKSFVSLDGGDHLLTDPAIAQYAAEIIAAWAWRYVGGHDHDHPRSEEGVVRARTDGDSFATRISASGHPLVADEPVSVGGGGSGPTPYDLLAAALAACTSMTLRMYAARKEWPLDSVQVDVKHERRHCEDCEKRIRIDHFARKIRLSGPLDEEMRAKLLEIADKCPVHKSLHAEVRVETALLP